VEKSLKRQTETAKIAAAKYRAKDVISSLPSVTSAASNSKAALYDDFISSESSDDDWNEKQSTSSATSEILRKMDKQQKLIAELQRQLKGVILYLLN